MIEKDGSRRRHSLETRAKMSAVRTGKVMPIGVRLKIKAAMTGHIVTKETRKKMSEFRNRMNPNPSETASRRRAVHLYKLELGEPKECELCKSTLNLQIHHKDLNVFNNCISNFQVLCSRCHLHLHWSIKKPKIGKRANNGRLLRDED